MARALNRSEERTARAACREISLQDDKAPEWVQVAPPGPRIRGRDGRSFLLDDPDAVARASLRDSSGGPRERPVDWEHATEIKAPKGEEAPAAGWIKQMQSRADGLYARVEWTERGRNSVESREYRFVSPVLLYQTGTLRVVAIDSVALTNSPNLPLKALNREDPGGEGEVSVNEEERKQLASALGLEESATAGQILEAAKKARGDLAAALNRAENPPLDRFVPKAEYDRALERATNAESRVAELEEAGLDREIDEAVGKALKEGRITPASEEYFRAQCRKEGGLEEFRKFVAGAPEIAGGESGAKGVRPKAAHRAGSESDEARKVREAFGHSREDLDKYGPEAS